MRILNTPHVLDQTHSMLTAISDLVDSVWLLSRWFLVGERCLCAVSIRTTSNPCQRGPDQSTALLGLATILWLGFEQ